jgi:hypothetical protein
MTRPELFQELVQHADKLPWGVELPPDGSLVLWSGDDYYELWPDTKDTDPDACVFIVWGLEWLESQEDTGGKLNPMLFRRPDGQYECAFPDRIGEFVASTRLDAVLSALVAVLRAMKDREGGE